MPYEFTEWDDEPETQPSSSHSGSPPRKHTGVGILEPGEFPRNTPIAIPWSFLKRAIGLLILIGFIVGIALMLVLPTDTPVQINNH